MRTTGVSTPWFSFCMQHNGDEPPEPIRLWGFDTKHRNEPPAWPLGRIRNKDMNKQRVLELIIEKLSADLELLTEAARRAHEAATHEENIPDNKYDTLSLEASYIAQAQANRAQDIRGALDAFKALALRDFDEDAPIRLTALVTLEGQDGSKKTLFIGPREGGLRVTLAGTEVTVITPESPVGREIIGKTLGDALDLRTEGTGREFEIVAVC